jgi:hypothetical protein
MQVRQPNPLSPSRQRYGLACWRGGSVGMLGMSAASACGGSKTTPGGRGERSEFAASKGPAVARRFRLLRQSDIRGFSPLFRIEIVGIGPVFCGCAELANRRLQPLGHSSVEPCPGRGRDSAVFRACGKTYLRISRRQFSRMWPPSAREQAISRPCRQAQPVWSG